MLFVFARVGGEVELMLQQNNLASFPEIGVCHSQAYTVRHPYQQMKARMYGGPCPPLAHDEGTASRTRSRPPQQLLKTG